MESKDYIPPCEKIGHTRTRFLAIFHYLDGSFNSEYYCNDCNKAFTRPSSLEEIAKYKSLMETKSL